MATYPRAFGSIQNEFVAYHEDLLFKDVNLFNDNVLDYLA